MGKNEMNRNFVDNFILIKRICLFGLPIIKVRIEKYKIKYFLFNIIPFFEINVKNIDSKTK